MEKKSCCKKHLEKKRENNPKFQEEDRKGRAHTKTVTDNADNTWLRWKKMNFFF